MTLLSLHILVLAVCPMSGQDRSVAFVAGLSYGPFRLQAPLVEVVRLLREEATTYGVVEVERCDDDSMTLFLPRYQARLVFDGVSQRLSRVVVSLANAGDIFYRGRVFCNARFPATFAHVYDVIGPTFRGEVTDDDHYVLQYPGMKVFFAIPHEYVHLFSEEDAHPTTLPNGAAPIAARLVVERQSERVSSPIRAVQSGDHVSIHIGRGVEFHRISERLSFGSCPQDAISLLGLPASVFLKHDDRMQVQSAAPGTQNDYFLNYPLLGLDLLYSGTHHGLTKFVIHNPYPLHQSFLQVHKCIFSCVLPLEFWQPSTIIDNKTSWKWLQEQYKGPLPKPLIASTGCLNGAVMRVYCLHGLVVYVLPDGTIPQIVAFLPSPIPDALFREELHSLSPPPRSDRHSPQEQEERHSGSTINISPPTGEAIVESGMSHSRPVSGDSPIPDSETPGDLAQQQDRWNEATPVGESPIPGDSEVSPPPELEEDEGLQRPTAKKKKKKSSR
jgi:hypothetical protein